MLVKCWVDMKYAAGKHCTLICRWRKYMDPRAVIREATRACRDRGAVNSGMPRPAVKVTVGTSNHD